MRINLIIYFLLLIIYFYLKDNTEFFLFFAQLTLSLSETMMKANRMFLLLKMF